MYILIWRRIGILFQLQLQIALGYDLLLELEKRTIIGESDLMN